MSCTLGFALNSSSIEITVVPSLPLCFINVALFASVAGVPAVLPVPTVQLHSPLNHYPHLAIV